MQILNSKLSVCVPPQSHKPSWESHGPDVRYPIGTHFRANDLEWIRVPDVARLFGIKRSKLYELLRDGCIESISLRKRGRIRGVRLISTESLRNFLNQQRKREGI